MENFQFSMPTQVYFGKDEIKQLPAVISQYGKRVLLTYGGGSIKRMGIYDKVKELLADCEIFELGGIVPNPRVESVREGAAICKKEKIDVVLAIGGGSVIDCSKGTPVRDKPFVECKFYCPCNRYARVYPFK